MNQMTRRLAYRLGLFLSLILTAYILLPLGQQSLSHGPANIGHEYLDCRACHRGNIVYQAVDNSACLDCHSNDEDRHPVEQFMQAEFVSARASIGAHRCTHCHQQHRGSRVSIAVDFCQHCHFELELEPDPIDISHARLIQQRQWASCLGCHDFHGNHQWAVPTEFARRLPEQMIRDYFNGLGQPYGYRRVSVSESLRLDDE